MHDLMLLKMFRFFMDNPYQQVYLRQLAKKTGLSPFAVKKYADLLVKEGLILEEKKANLRYFKANMNSLFFRHLKIAFNLSTILKSSLIDFLKEKLSNVSSIMLFGSMAKGENDEKSDIDILIIGKEKYLDLSKFEEKLGKDMSVHIFSWSEWNKKAKTDKAFYLDIISSGIALYGEKPVV